MNMGIESYGDTKSRKSRKGATTKMTSKKKTREPQASQELSQGSTKFRIAEPIAAYEPMTGDQASHLKRLRDGLMRSSTDYGSVFCRRIPTKRAKRLPEGVATTFMSWLAATVLGLALIADAGTAA